MVCWPAPRPPADPKALPPNPVEVVGWPKADVPEVAPAGAPKALVPNPPVEAPNPVAGCVVPNPVVVGAPKVLVVEGAI